MSTYGPGIARARYTRDESGETIVETYVVKPGGAARSRPTNAVSASAVPPYDQPHPARPALRARSYSSETMRDQPDTWLVTVTFRQPDALQDPNELGSVSVSMSTQIITEEITRDINGQQMRTKYAQRLPTAFVVTDRVHRVSVERPTFGLTFERTENSAAFSKATTYAGKVNSLPWQGKPAKAWLIRVSSSQLPNGLFRVTYDAVFNPDTWVAELLHSEDGVVPTDVSDVNGRATYDVYEGIDFNQLRLERVL